MYGTRHYRRVDGPGHGAQAGVVVVDEHLQRGGCDGAEGEEQRENWDLPFMEVFGVGSNLSAAWEGEPGVITSNAKNGGS